MNSLRHPSFLFIYSHTIPPSAESLQIHFQCNFKHLYQNIIISLLFVLIRVIRGQKSHISSPSYSSTSSSSISIASPSIIFVFSSGNASTFLNFLSIALDLTPALSITLAVSCNFFFVFSSKRPKFPNSVFTAPGISHTSLDRFCTSNVLNLIRKPVKYDPTCGGWGGRRACGCRGLFRFPVVRRAGSGIVFPLC